MNATDIEPGEAPAAVPVTTAPEAPAAAAETAPLATLTSADAARALDHVLRDLRGDARASEQQLEALLFSAHVPLTVPEIAAALSISAEQAQQALQRLEAQVAERPSAVALFTREKNGQRAFMLDLKTAYRKDAASVAPPMLKPVVTETLALIAMNQPLSQSRLVRERGQTVYEHMKELMARGLVQRQRKGRNFFIRTTDAFAAEFGLDNDPELIRRALARAAGVQGTPEVIGSGRIRFDADAGAGADLVAEARTFVPPPPAPAPPEAPAVSLAAEAREDCVVSGGEPPVAEVASAEPAPAPEAIVEVAPAPEVAAPALEAVTAPTQEETVSRPEDEEPAREARQEKAEVVDPKAASLLAMFQDQATTDDW